MSHDVPNPKVGIMASTAGASPANDPASDTFSGTSAIPLRNQKKKEKKEKKKENMILEIYTNQKTQGNT